VPGFPEAGWFGSGGPELGPRPGCDGALPPPWEARADRLEQPAAIEAIGPFECGGLKTLPRPASMDHMGFEHPDDRLSRA
jgi:hypothetical protein